MQYPAQSPRPIERISMYESISIDQFLSRETATYICRAAHDSRRNSPQEFVCHTGVRFGIIFPILGSFTDSESVAYRRLLKSVISLARVDCALISESE